MAKSTEPKAEGRIKQIFRVLSMTAKTDKSSLPLILGAFLGVIALGVVIGLVTKADVLSWILIMVTSVLGAVLAGLATLSRKAMKVAYSNLRGQPGAVSAILKDSLRRGWRGSEIPIAANAKHQDLLYRLVGPGGIVLIAEGAKTRTALMVEEERRKLSKIAQGVPTSVIWVTSDENGTDISKLNWTILRTPRKLNRKEVSVVAKRVESFQFNAPIPKGIDPRRMRAQRR